jgi:hypothetical protein
VRTEEVVNRLRDGVRDSGGVRGVRAVVVAARLRLRGVGVSRVAARGAAARRGVVVSREVAAIRGVRSVEAAAAELVRTGSPFIAQSEWPYGYVLLSASGGRTVFLEIR